MCNILRIIHIFFIIINALDSFHLATGWQFAIFKTYITILHIFRQFVFTSYFHTLQMRRFANYCFNETIQDYWYAEKHCKNVSMPRYFWSDIFVLFTLTQPNIMLIKLDTNVKNITPHAPLILQHSFPLNIFSFKYVFIIHIATFTSSVFFIASLFVTGNVIIWDPSFVNNV